MALRLDTFDGRREIERLRRKRRWSQAFHRRRPERIDLKLDFELADLEYQFRIQKIQEQAAKARAALSSYRSRSRSWRERYREYLETPEWRQKREAVRRRCGNICESCQAAPMADCHHLSYDRLGDESLDDLQGLCRQCHWRAHGLDKEATEAA